jgi:NADPH:quinone reductase-like Zn-dependent oxidoreductase
LDLTSGLTGDAEWPDLRTALVLIHAGSGGVGTFAIRLAKHKESIDLAVTEEGGELCHHGQIGGDMSALWRAVRKLESLGRQLAMSAN